MSACQSTYFNIVIFRFRKCILVAKDGIHVYILGTQESAKWNLGTAMNDTATITYSTNIRTTVVHLQCSTSGEEEFEVLNDPTFFVFRLSHKCACWNGCSSEYNNK